MNFKKICLLISFILVSSSVAAHLSPKQKGYVVVTDYIKNDGKKDVSDAIQKIIDNNPNRTIYFPDGTYLISALKRSISIGLIPYKQTNTHARRPQEERGAHALELRHNTRRRQLETRRGNDSLRRQRPVQRHTHSGQQLFP